MMAHDAAPVPSVVPPICDLYVTAHYPPDFVSGATLQVQRLAEQAAAAGHDVAVFSGAITVACPMGRRPPSVLNGVDVRWIGSAGWIDQDDDRNWDNPVATAAGATLLDEFEPDVVHAHALQTLGAGVIDAALDRRTRVVLTMHDLWWWCARLFLVDRDMRAVPARHRRRRCARAPARRTGGRIGPAHCGARSTASTRSSCPRAVDARPRDRQRGRPATGQSRRERRRGRRPPGAPATRR